MSQDSDQEDSDVLDALDKTRDAYRDLWGDFQRLRRENDALITRNEMLSLKIAATMKPNSAHMPPEILEMILREALPPSWMLGQMRESLGQTLRSRTISQKLCFMLVCKAWHGVATQLFYESVYIHRVEQIPAFVRTLENRDGLGGLVRDLEVSCFVPAEYKLLFEDETFNIFQRLCPRITRFAFLPNSAAPSVASYLPAVTSNLTRLEFGADVDFDVVQTLLARVYATLRYLKLCFFPRENASFRDHLALPHLEALHVEILYAKDMGPPPFIIWDWPMPNLRRMWLSASHGTPFSGKSGPVVERFLARYGSRLEFLSLNMCLDRLRLTHIRPCTNLVHLVLDSKSVVLSHTWFYEAESHPTLQYLDIWLPRVGDFGLRELDPGAMRIIQAQYPSLRACRYFDATYSFFLDLPLRYPPDEPWGAGQSGFDADSHIRSVDAGASSASPPWLRAIEDAMLPLSSFGSTPFFSWSDDFGDFRRRWWDGSTSDDEEDEFSSDDSESTDSEIDAEIDEEEDGVEVVRQVNREEVLEMFWPS